MKCEAVTVDSEWFWRPQEVRDARNVGYLPGKARRPEWTQWKGGRSVCCKQPGCMSGQDLRGTHLKAMCPNTSHETTDADSALI